MRKYGTYNFVQQTKIVFVSFKTIETQISQGFFLLFYRKLLPLAIVQSAIRSWSIFICHLAIFFTSFTPNFLSALFFPNWRYCLFKNFFFDPFRLFYKKYTWERLCWLTSSMKPRFTSFIIDNGSKIYNSFKVFMNSHSLFVCLFFFVLCPYNDGKYCVDWHCQRNRNSPDLSSTTNASYTKMTLLYSSE